MLRQVGFRRHTANLALVAIHQVESVQESLSVIRGLMEQHLDKERGG